MNVRESITLRELMAEMLPPWESKALETIDVCVPDENDACDEKKAYRPYLARFIFHEKILVVKDCMLN